MKQRSVALIGVYPPPVGGISVHIQRLCDALEARGIPFTVYDNTPGDKDRDVVYTGPIESWTWKYLFRCKEEVVHVHFLRWQVRFVLALLGLRGKRVIFTFHSMREEEQLSRVKRLGIKLTSRLAEAFIVVNEEIGKRLVAYGVDPAKIHCIPPFIPPKPVDGELPEVLKRFLGGDHTRLVLANGAVGSFFEGVDLYGCDLYMDLCEKVAAVNPDVRFVYSVTHVVNRDYYDHLRQQVQTRGLADKFLFLESPDEYQTILRKADLFVRPTYSDGDAISLREALHFRIPSIASDAVDRPPLTVLFENRNLDDLYEKVTAVLNGDVRIAFDETAQPDYADAVIRLYRL